MRFWDFAVFIRRPQLDFQKDRDIWLEKLLREHWKMSVTDMNMKTKGIY
jgi:hypothetical protein